MNIGISYYSAIGNRADNEDAVSLLEGNSGLLAIVADGLGGHERGEVASEQAVKTLNYMLQSQPINEDALLDAIRQANMDILSRQIPGRPMRTTVAVLWMNDEYGLAAHVGDTRIYQFRDDQIVYQSLDHSVAQMAVMLGEISESDIRSSKDRNKLIRALGDEYFTKPDCEMLRIQRGDRLLVCSDGFWEPVSEKTMLQTTAQSETAQQWLTLMKDVIKQTDAPRQDNHTAIALVIDQ